MITLTVNVALFFPLCTVHHYVGSEHKTSLCSQPNPRIPCCHIYGRAGAPVDSTARAYVSLIDPLAPAVLPKAGAV